MASPLQSASCARNSHGLLQPTPSCGSGSYVALFDNNFAALPNETKAVANAKVRWPWLCRSGKVRGWHFNCAYVIYGACRASLAKLFETETQFIGLGWPWGSDRNARKCLAVWWISTDKQTCAVSVEEGVCETRLGQRCAWTRLNDSLMWFCSVKLNSALTRWLCPWTGW